MKFSKMARYWLYGILISMCFGCAQRTAEEKASWVIERVENKLDLNQEQMTKLLSLSQSIMAAQSNFEGNLQGGIAQFFQGNVFEEREALNEMDRQWSQFRAVAADIVPKVGEFYNTLDKKQKEQFIALLEEHRYRSKGHSIWGGQFRHGRG